MPPDRSRGSPYPLGATVREQGTNFAIYSENAERVDLCLFDSARDKQPAKTIPLTGRTAGVFHAFVPGVRSGQVYAYRVSGPWAPERGHRFDASKVLLDPYSRAVARTAKWQPSVYSYVADEHPDPSVIDQVHRSLDSGATGPLGIVIEPSVRWTPEDRPRTAWEDTLIYELHVRGFTKLRPDVAPEERGTYRGLASEPVIEYLRGLGVSAVELLPVQHFVTERRLQKLGLTNYWGYQPLAYFAPEPAYAAAVGAGAVDEFRWMVRRLHRAGIEVILDVVFNHTGELGHDGPTLSFRGVDNAMYYRLEASDPRCYVNYTGCGNTLNTCHPVVLRMLLDSLRYWVETMGVDGFRFDLAATLGRTSPGSFDRWAPLFAAIGQEPALQGIKLIAEPWDLKDGDGDQLGNFPPEWSEWNRCFRDDVRRYWMGHNRSAAIFATRLAGSSDIFAPRQRAPRASINFVSSHDGFTLADLVTYQKKRNLANGEENRDGEDWNHNWNCGVEGPTADVATLALRERQRRNLLATLLLSQGVPMLAAGDEFGRTQGGNNNAYCQDNESSWLNWSSAAESATIRFVRALAGLRRSEGSFRRESYFEGSVDPKTGRRDIAWLLPDGAEIDPSGWDDSELTCFGAEIAGRSGLRYLLLCNPTANVSGFVLPEDTWLVLIDTSSSDPQGGRPAESPFELPAYALALLRSSA